MHDRMVRLSWPKTRPEAISRARTASSVPVVKDPLGGFRSSRTWSHAVVGELLK
jgi:hypothetical protein